LKSPAAPNPTFTASGTKIFVLILAVLNVLFTGFLTVNQLFAGANAGNLPNLLK
jgi:hypothetical protein